MAVTVAKFGGTSVANGENLRRLKDIISSNPCRKIVVVSAPGKRSSNDIKITDSLLKIYALKKAQQPYAALLAQIKKRFIEIENELDINANIEGEFGAFEKQLKTTSASEDFIASRGEYFSAKLTAQFLGYEFADAANIFIFKDKNKIDLAATQKAFNKIYKAGKKIVVPGFYGTFASGGKIVTFSRGGSDISGAILACCANAAVYENWTDVSGFLAADPRIVKNPRQIICLTYRDLRELSYMGASVLHTDCAFYASKKNIPINIKNTFNPAHPGTLILSERDINLKSGGAAQITGLTGQKGFSLIYIEKYNLNDTIGVFESLAKIFAQYGISIEHMPTNIDGISVVFRHGSINEKQIKSLTAAIKRTLEPDKVLVMHNLALVCIVLGRVNITDGLKKIFACLHKNNIETVTTSKDSSSLSVNIGIKEADYEKTIKCLYDAFEKQKNG